MNINLCRISGLVGVSLAVSSSGVFAQETKLPGPSRTVYKCVAAGKIVYTDEPCAGAQRVDVEPTRGLNKSTGKEVVGSDVSRERSREAFSEAVRPITGMDRQQLDTYSRRTKLTPESRAECARLDGTIAEGENQERTASARERPVVQRALLLDRQRHKKLDC